MHWPQSSLKYIFEPALSDCNSLFYGTNFHRFISHVMYSWLATKEKSAELLFEEFSQLMRRLDPNKIIGFFSRDELLINTDKVTNAIATFAFLNRRHVNDELSVIRGDGAEPNWVPRSNHDFLIQPTVHVGRAP